MPTRDFSIGLPDPARFGRVTKLPLNVPISYVRQLHKARRAGRHFDVRLGQAGGPNKLSLLSWALKHWPGKPGEKRLAFRQPLHRGSYANFEGEIRSGYGAGTVTTADKGRVRVTHVSPDKIKFSVINKKHPSTFALIRKSGPPTAPKTPREKKTQGGTWLMVNTTSTAASKPSAVLKAAALRMRLWPGVKSARIQASEKGSAGMHNGPLTAMIRRATETLGGEGETLADFAKVAGAPAVAVPALSPELQQAIQQAQGGMPTLGDRLRGLLLGMQPKQVVHLRSGLSGISKAVETMKSLAKTLKGQQAPTSVRTPPAVAVD